MTPRELAREVRDYPATFVFCLSWVVIFVAMTYTQLAEGGRVPLFHWLLPGFDGGHRFGDLSLQDLRHGQVWRLITCNFIHYSLVHIVLNVMSMYVLGTLVESWYGSHLFVFIYGLTGGVGNMVSALIRYSIRSNPQVHSAGGSVVILGLAGLCAVAGWRSRNPEGRSLGRLMTIFLGLTAILGIAFPSFFDNWGHAGGALVGAALGLAHRWFLAQVSKPSAWGLGMLTGLVIAACGAAQWVTQSVEGRREALAREENFLIQRSGDLEKIFQDLIVIGQLVGRRGDLEGALESLNVMERMLAGQPQAEIRGLRPLVEAAMTRPLSDPQRQEFEQRLGRVVRGVRQEYHLRQNQLRQLRSVASDRRTGQ
jgi:membrane associated rhomboid family serine protease